MNDGMVRQESYAFNGSCSFFNLSDKAPENGQSTSRFIGLDLYGLGNLRKPTREA